MKYAAIALCSLVLSYAKATERPDNLTPEEALNQLMAGNQRFIAKEFIHKDVAKEVADLKQGQEPFAVVIGCSDSRVPPEIIFDQGPGDLFVVRDAGNVIGPIELDSALFAVKKLHAPLVVVLGHEYCGAVSATLLGRANVPELSNIYPLLERALKKCNATKGDILENAVNCNVQEGVRDLTDQPAIQELIKAKKLKVVGAYFNFDTGTVSLVE